MKRIFLITLVLVCLIFSAQAEVKTFSGNIFPISVDTAGEHTYIFDGVTIYGVNDEVYDPNDWDVLIYWLYLPPISFEASQAKLTIVLKDGTDNKLISDDSLAAITLTGNVELIIRCESAGEGHECNDLCGSLTITGDRYGPGIGAGVKDSGTSHLSGSLTIDGGNISIQGGAYAAGIGGGRNGNLSGNVTINGGNVTIQGGAYASGIGGGYQGNLTGAVTINGGNVTVTGDDHSAGIGGSNRGDLSGNVTINGGNVTVKGGADGAGIGGGENGDLSGAVTITGGTVRVSTLSGQYGDAELYYGSGIGSGAGGELTGSVTITGGKVTTGSTYEFSAGIGSRDMMSGDITISGGEVEVFAGDHCAAIGGVNGMSGDITVSGGKVLVSASPNSVGIGNAFDGDMSGDITVSGGYMEVCSSETSSRYSPAIGGSWNSSMSGTVRITGGEVIAVGTSGEYPAIGAGHNGTMTGSIVVDPAVGLIKVENGLSQWYVDTEAAALKYRVLNLSDLSGSPYAARTDITSLLKDKSYVHFVNVHPSPTPTSTPAPAPTLPETGDSTDFALLIALAAAGLIGMAGFLRRKNEA